MQARLLAALHASAREPWRRARFDVRIIAATNRDLLRGRCATANSCEAPATPRSAMLAIELPPLRARVEDIPRCCRTSCTSARDAWAAGCRRGSAFPVRALALLLAGQHARARESGRARDGHAGCARAENLHGLIVGSPRLPSAPRSSPPRPAIPASHAHDARRARRFRRHAEHRAARRAARTHPARAQCHALGHRRQLRRRAQARPETRDAAPSHEEAGNLARCERGRAASGGEARYGDAIGT